MRILLADDQPDVRSALRLLLEQETGFQIVAEAADSTGLLLALDRHQPDLVLLDWELPGLPAGQLVRLLHYELPPVQVYAMSSRPEAERDALAQGADAFLCKGDPAERFLGSLRGTRNNRQDAVSHGD